MVAASALCAGAGGGFATPFDGWRGHGAGAGGAAAVLVPSPRTRRAGQRAEEAPLPEVAWLATMAPGRPRPASHGVWLGGWRGSNGVVKERAVSSPFRRHVKHLRPGGDARPRLPGRRRVRRPVRSQ